MDAKIAKWEIAKIISTCPYMGGEADPDGKVLQQTIWSEEEQAAIDHLAACQDPVLAGREDGCGHPISIDCMEAVE